MKTVTLRSLRRDTGLLDAAAGGEEILVTRFGKPYVRIVPAKQPRSFLGAGKHLGLIVRHTDSGNEFAYDRKALFGRLDKALDAAKKKGWIIADMTKDWSRVFPKADR